jgi:hypothetical protein
MTDATKYQVMAYSADGRWIDTSAERGGEPTYVIGAGAMLALLAITDAGTLRDLDAEIESVEPVAYFRVSALGADGRYYYSETHVTRYGRAHGLTDALVRHAADGGSTAVFDL